MVVNPRRQTQSMASQTAGGSIYCQGRQGTFRTDEYIWKEPLSATRAPFSQKNAACAYTSRKEKFGLLVDFEPFLTEMGSWGTD